jgi:hypothetical protein
VLATVAEIETARANVHDGHTLIEADATLPALLAMVYRCVESACMADLKREHHEDVMAAAVLLRRKLEQAEHARRKGQKIRRPDKHSI